MAVAETHAPQSVKKNASAPDSTTMPASVHLTVFVFIQPPKETILRGVAFFCKGGSWPVVGGVCLDPYALDESGAAGGPQFAIRFRDPRDLKPGGTGAPRRTDVERKSKSMVSVIAVSSKLTRAKKSSRRSS